MKRSKYYKLILLISIILINPISTQAQTYIKTNALYWLALLPNAQIETKIANRTTFQGEVNGSLWTFDGKPMQGVQLIVGARWYPKKEFKGFYMGGDFGFDIFKVTKWNYWTNYPNYTQKGIGYYLGVTLGYQTPISKRWNMDFYAGGGWHLGKYYGIDRITNTMYVPWNGSGEWIPYKLGVTFAYRLGDCKK